jgi:flagellar hook-associated protein 3 FlgL
MQTFSVGDMATSLLLSRQGASLKSAMQTLSTEATTGLASDQTAKVKGNYVPIAGIESSLTQLAAYSSVTSETQVITNVMQVALGTISDQASSLGSAMLAGTTSNSTIVVDALGVQAAQKLQTVMAALNTKVGDRSVFSGVKSDQAAVGSADDLLASLQGAITASGAITSGEVETAVNAWFDDPNGYAAQSYTGGEALAPVAIGPGQTAQVDVTAKDPAIIATLKSLARCCRRACLPVTAPRVPISPSGRAYSWRALRRSSPNWVPGLVRPRPQSRTQSPAMTRKKARWRLAV